MTERAPQRALEGLSDRTAARRALRDQLQTAMPDLRVIAEGFLAEVSAIDLLAVGRDGELVSIRLTEPGEDAAALTRSLADLAWLRPRRSDLAQLAPGLGIEPSVEPRALLVARGFGPETRSAAEELPAEKVQLWHCGSVSLGAQVSRWLEPRTAGDATPAPTAAPSPRAASRPVPTTPPSPASSRAPAWRAPRPERTRRPADPPSPSTFRTGLAESDLEPPHGRAARNPRRSETGATHAPEHLRGARGAAVPKSDVFRHR